MVSLSRSCQPATLHSIFGENVVVYIIGKALSVENFVYIIGKGLSGELSCTGTVFFFMPRRNFDGILKSNGPSVRPSVRPSVTNRVSVISHKLLEQI